MTLPAKIFGVGHLSDMSDTPPANRLRAHSLKKQ